MINMRKEMIVAPSILAADFSNLKEEIKACEDAGAEYIHFDVMDGNFVPNISFGIPVLKSVSKIHRMVNDVHLMISDPLKYIPAFAKAGADIITFHYEALENDEQVMQCIELIHSLRKKAGISLKPETPAENIFPFLEALDLVLVMSVEPGFGGQEFMDSVLPKMLAIKNKIEFLGLSDRCLVEVDGGIDIDTAKKAAGFGADILVTGTYVFGHKDLEFRIAKLRSLA